MLRFEEWDGCSRHDSLWKNVLCSFDADYDHQQKAVIIAYYGYVSYDGQAFVLFQDTNTGVYYEVNGRHCSCYGLEGQWEPEETTLEQLLLRKSFSYGGPNEEIRAAIIDQLAADKNL